MRVTLGVLLKTGRKHRFCTHNVRTNRLGGEIPTPRNRNSSPNKKTIFFSPLAGGEKRVRAGTEVAEKVFKKSA